MTEITSTQILIQKVRRVVFSRSLWGFGLLGGGCLLLASLFGAGFFSTVGWLAVGGAVATTLWKLTGGRARFHQQAIDDLRRRGRRRHHAYLRTLRSRLRKDGDPQTSHLVKELFRIYERLDKADIQSVSETKVALPPLEHHAAKLYQSCLSLMERSLEMWEGAREMTTPETRRRVLEARSELVNEVRRSVRRIDASLDHLQAVRLQPNIDHKVENVELQEELQRGLDVARQVEEQMESLELDLRSREGA